MTSATLYDVCCIHLQPHSHTLKPKMDVSSDEFILDHLSTCEQKLVMLVEELSSRDLETIQKEMEDHETCSTMVDFVPANNTRVTIPKTTSHSTMFGEHTIYCIHNLVYNMLYIQKVIVAVMKSLYLVRPSREMSITCWILKLKRNHKMMMTQAKRNEESEQLN